MPKNILCYCAQVDSSENLFKTNLVKFYFIKFFGKVDWSVVDCLILDNRSTENLIEVKTKSCRGSGSGQCLNKAISKDISTELFVIGQTYTCPNIVSNCFINDKTIQ